MMRNMSTCSSQIHRGRRISAPLLDRMLRGVMSCVMTMEGPFRAQLNENMAALLRKDILYEVLDREEVVHWCCFCGE